MMRILHLVDSLQVGGAQKLINCFARQAIQHGVAVSVVSLSDISGKIPAEDLATIGIPVSVFAANRLIDLKRITNLIRFMRSQPFDLVHTHLTYGNILGGLAGQFCGLPVVMTLHSTGNDQASTDTANFRSPRNRIETFALRNWASRVMAVGNSVAQAHRPRLKGKPIDVIVNPVPQAKKITTEERQSLRYQILGNQDGVILISVGRFAKVKELPELINAFSIVKTRHPQAKLVLIGDGSERTRVENTMKELDLVQDVILLGRRNDVSEWLQASDLYVSASSLEGLPVAVLEAMAAGLPVITTGVGDLPQVVLPETGLLVHIHNPVQLAEAVCQLIDQPAQRHAMGAAAQAHTRASYDVATWFTQVMDLYGEVLHQNGKELPSRGNQP